MLLSQVQEQAEGVRFLQRVVEGHLTSPLMLVGMEGVGRRFSVIETAREMFGDDEFHTLLINEGTHPDLKVVFPEGDKDIGVEAIRGVVQETFSFPSSAPVRFFVIDGADRMTPAAANALLKTLEEPPATSRFFLLAQSNEQVLPTIRSRCGVVRYHPLSEALVLSHLSKFESDGTKALVYARLAEGSIGRALSLWGSGRLALRDQVLGLLKIGLSGDTASLFATVDGLQTELPLALRFLEHLLQDLAMISYRPERLTNVDITDDLAALKKQVGVQKLKGMREGLRALLRKTYLRTTLPFHTKAFLATTLEGC